MKMKYPFNAVEIIRERIAHNGIADFFVLLFSVSSLCRLTSEFFRFRISTVLLRSKNSSESHCAVILIPFDCRSTLTDALPDLSTIGAGSTITVSRINTS